MMSANSNDPKKSLFDIGITSVDDVEIEIVQPHLGIEPQQFSQGAQVLIRFGGQQVAIDISDGLYRILPNLDLPLRNEFRKWQTKSPYCESFVDHFSKSFFSSIEQNVLKGNLDYLLMSLPREVKEVVKKYSKLIVPRDDGNELALALGMLEEITPEFAELCDTVMAKVSNYPNLYKFLTRPRINPIDIGEFKLIAKRILDSDNSDLAFYEQALACVRERFEENIVDCVTAAFGTTEEYDFSIDRIFGRVLARNGKVFIPPSAPAVIANRPDNGLQKIITPDQIRATNALLCSYVIRCAELSESIDDAFQSVFLYAEMAVANFRKDGQMVAHQASTLQTCDDIAIDLAQQFTGWDIMTSSWIYSPFADQGFDYRGTEGLASAIFGARVDSPSPVISFRYF
ncbi:MAG: hypothetical protein U0R17_06320 [Acidimicrobiia bacterium]